MFYVSFAKKFDQRWAKIKADMMPVLKMAYKQAVDGYINFHKRSTILLKAFCHNAVNICMGLSLKSFAALTLLPAVLIFATVDLSSRGEKDAQKMKATIAAQLQNTRTNTQAMHVGIDIQQQQKIDTTDADAIARHLAIGLPKIAAPVSYSENFVTSAQGTRDAGAYLDEARKAAKIEPAAGR